MARAKAIKVEEKVAAKHRDLADSSRRDTATTATLASTLINRMEGEARAQFL